MQTDESETVESKPRIGILPSKVISKRGDEPRALPRTDTTAEDAPSASPASSGSSAKTFVLPADAVRSVRLIANDMTWAEQGMDLLLDNNVDFLVIGVLGLQGSGKSTITSLLAGNQFSDLYRLLVFRPQSFENMEHAWHQTAGVDMFVTHERVILLDCQPLFSNSVLELLMDEKQVPPEYGQVDKYAEMQSMQLLTLLMSVCHCLVCVADWFVDVPFLRLIQTAESLRPVHSQLDLQPAVAAADGSGASALAAPAQPADSFPHFVFLLNRAPHELFAPLAVARMQRCLSALFAQSNLKCQSRPAQDEPAAAGHQSPPTAEERAGVRDAFNLFLLPQAQRARPPQTTFAAVPDFQGHPPFELCLTRLRNFLYALPRTPLAAQQPLTEKAWYHFAARTWDAIKKSSLISEFARLLD